MFSVIPAVSLVLLVLIIFPRSEDGWRSAVLRAAIVWGVALTIITELLSLFKLLTPMWVGGAWSLFGISLFLIYRQSNQEHKRSRVNVSWDEGYKVLLDPHIRLSLIGLLIIFSLIGLIALVAPPNTNDSMGYHMPRVVNWIQNHTVAHYPTHYTAQLFLSPWSAFAVLHLQILSGGDRYANLVQFFSMIGSAVGVSLIAQQFGANLYGQVLAAVFCATIPMGILQASSTQNDYVVAFWLICFVYYVLCTLRNQPDKNYFWEIGFSLGLATLTKPTAYIYSFPFLVWLLISQLSLEKWRFGKPRLWANFLKILVPFVLISIFHFLRNIDLFQTPLGKSPQFINYTNKVFSIPVLVSNIVRNLSLHLATPSSSINQSLFNLISWIHSILEVDINDPRTSGLDFQVNSLINHEDLAGNTLHLLIIIASIASFSYLLQRNALPKALLMNYVLSIFICFLLFCLLLTWTPFHSRLQLFMFVAAAPFVGMIFSTMLRPKAVSFMAIALILVSLPWVFFNETRPLIANSHFLTSRTVENIFNMDRSELYFMGDRSFKDPMIEATQLIKSQQCADVGLSFYYLRVFEYPIWALLQRGSSKAYHFQHVGVTNESQIKSTLPRFRSFQPCIILNDTRSDFDNTFEQRSEFNEVWSATPLNLLSKAD